MKIPAHIENAVRAKVLADLASYFVEAAIAEDEETITDINAAERLKDFYLYQHLTGKELYVIHTDPYMGGLPEMVSFMGSFRELLLHLNDVEKSMLEDWVPYKLFRSKMEWKEFGRATYPNHSYDLIKLDHDEKMTYGGQTVGEWDGFNGVFLKPYGNFTDQELLDIFNKVNGDGQSYRTVYSVREGRKVIG